MRMNCMNPLKLRFLKYAFKWRHAVQTDIVQRAVFSFRLYRFTLAEIVLHQWTQFALQDISICNVLGQVELPIRVHFQVKPLSELWGWWEEGVVGANVWEWLDKIAAFVPCPSEAVVCVPQLPGFKVRFTRCLGLGTTLSSRQGYELVSLLWMWQKRPKGLHGLFWGYLSQARLCTEFPDQMGSPFLLCKWGKPQAVLSVQVPLSAGMLDELHSFLCVLVRFSAQEGCRLYAATGRSTN